jgi:hypothetical protein
LEPDYLVEGELCMRSRLVDLFLAHQEFLSASLRGNRLALEHPGAKGEASEQNWIDMFDAHLPRRYSAKKAFVIDAVGECSAEIDIVIFDHQYAPMFFNRDRQRFIPAESVYAVFEVKQSLGRSEVVYAAEKAASVRRLARTSARIAHAGGEYEPRPLFPIIAGILAYESQWSPPLGDSLVAALAERSDLERLDLGCAVSQGSFEATYQSDGTVELHTSPSESALVDFFLRLLARLQCLGTAPAVNYDTYMQGFDDVPRA